jgi:hypothetical protein
VSAASALIAGIFGALAAALLGFRRRPRLGRDALLTAIFVVIGALAFDDEATERLLAVPAQLGEPARSKFCPPLAEEEEEPAAAPVPAPVVEQPGCALVKRAFELGYAKDLGDCAPKQVELAAPVAAAPRREVCRLRQHDEPYLHFAWRRLRDTAGDLTEADPVGVVTGRVDALQTRLDFLDTLMAQQLHAITTSPHASHHLWISLPDPRRGDWLGDLLEPPRCDDRYVDLPLWPSWGPALSEAGLVQHVLGQLLFATRFGKAPASCRDVVVHWDAPADACARLAADPAGFLAGQGALEPVRAVLDRRRRQIELRALAAALGHRPTVAEPPPAEVVVSLQCFVVDPEGDAAPRGFTVELDGVALGVREVRVPAVRTDGAGPIDVYRQLGGLLVGDFAAGEPTLPPPPEILDGDDFPLARLDAIHDADPFLGARWPLDRGDLDDVYPFHRPLGGYVEEFRRRYRAQRGRL